MGASSTRLPTSPCRRLLQSYDDADECTFAVDANQRIVYWNRAAEGLIGRSATEAIGGTCDRVIAGRLRGGGLCCRSRCAVWRLVEAGRHVESFDLLTSSRDGQPLWVTASSLVLRENGHPLLVHVFRDICGRKRLECLVGALLDALEEYGILDERAGRNDAHGAPDPTGERGAAGARTALTRREIDILRLVSRGYSTRSIAETLALSQHTVRNHVRNALSRAGLHSRAEAVSFAIRHGLL